MKVKNKVLLAIFIGTCIIIYFYFGSNYVDERKKEFDELFYSTSLNGELKEIDQYAHGCRIKIDGLEERFVFYPNVSEPSGRSFRNLAKPGDWITKPSYSDTLILIHTGKQYLFTFRLTK